MIKSYIISGFAGCFVFHDTNDSRNGTNQNSVRMFGPDKLTKAISTEKWDRVKVVCTQPFNKVNCAQFKS